MKKIQSTDLFRYLLSVAVFAVIIFVSTHVKAQAKPKEQHKDTVINFNVIGFTRTEFERVAKHRAKLDSIWQRDLIMFLEAKGVIITPDLQVISFDKGNLKIKTKK